MKSRTQKIAMAAMFAVLVCLATMLSIPLAIGNINLGDCVVLCTGWLCSPLYGFFAAGIGSLLADVILRYVIYAPVTFVLKGAMAVISWYVYKLLFKKAGKPCARGYFTDFYRQQ